MHTRILQSSGPGEVFRSVETIPEAADGALVWVDALVEEGDLPELLEFLTGLHVDLMSVRDAVTDVDLPKVDDFGDHLVVVLHGLRDDHIDTYEVDCFVTERHLVTVHTVESPALDALWHSLERGPGRGASTVDELLARLADVLTRRLLSVLDAFDDGVGGLIELALEADQDLLTEWMAVRTDVAAVRRVVHPQREALDLLRGSMSPLLTDSGRRLFADSFDVAVRAASGLDAARNELAEILDAYRGAEAREATDVTKVLTVYAAIMLPLSLVTGFFGMNFVELPLVSAAWGWLWVLIGMIVVAAVSLGVFVAFGWIRRPSGRVAGAALGRGLIEAARAPVHVVGAAYEISTMPLRSAAARRTRDK